MPGQHSFVQVLSLRMRFRRSKLYISVIPVLMIGFSIGTSLLHLLAVMAVTCVLHAVQSQSVDILLAFCLMVGSVAGAQFGVSAGQHLKGDQLRALLAIIVLGVAFRFALTLFIAPANLREFAGAVGSWLDLSCFVRQLAA